MLAIEELKSRGGSRRGALSVGGARSGEDGRGPISDFDARNSATAADVERGFSLTGCTSGSVVEVLGGFSVGYRSSSDNRR